MHGKQGLGRSDAPKKVAGARWAGTKVRLDSDDEELPEVEAASGDDEPEEGAVVVLASKKEQAGGRVPKEVLPCAHASHKAAKISAVGAIGGAKHTAAEQVTVNASGAPAAPLSPETTEGSKAEKIKWKKLARGVLKQAPRRKMKVQALRRRVLEAAGLQEGDLERSGRQLMKKLRSLPELFEVAEKFVRLI